MSQDFRRELSAKEPSINGTLDNVKSFLIEMPGEERKQTTVERGMPFIAINRNLTPVYLGFTRALILL